MNPKVDQYISKEKKWKKELETLQSILLDMGLTEELKWRQPCYTLEENNIAIIQSFKEFCALMFFKGALLKDPKKVLKSPGANSQASRRFEFTSAQEIIKMKPTLKAYIQEAIKIEKFGLKIKFKTEHVLVEELQKKLDKNSTLKKAFESLTPGRQRAYNLFISSAKQSKTREARVEKCAPKILKGKGLDD